MPLCVWSSPSPQPRPLSLAPVSRFMDSHCLSPSLPPNLPPLEQFIHRLCVVSLGLLGPSPPFSPLRTPQISAFGVASLLLGISSTLMLFGSFAFMVGFMLMPLVMFLMFVVCVGTVLASLTAPGIGFRVWGGNVLKAKRSCDS